MKTIKVIVNIKVNFFNNIKVNIGKVSYKGRKKKPVNIN